MNAAPIFLLAPLSPLIGLFGIIVGLLAGAILIAIRLRAKAQAIHLTNASVKRATYRFAGISRSLRS